MKRLLGLLLVMGMVGCGQTVDASKLVERDELWYEGDSETPFTGATVSKYENGQKEGEGTFKDGKAEGLQTIWHYNGKKRAEAIWKDGELVSLKNWDEEGNESNY